MRRTIQGAFALFCLYAGLRFAQYVAWITGRTDAFVPKPPSVEGFLPISALMAAKRFVLTGLWDAIHPAGLTLFLAFLGMALLFRKGFCGYICPVGFASSCVERLGRRLQWSREISPRTAALLAAPKYIILAGFVWFICISMPLSGIEQFLAAPYNLVADAKMLHFFMAPSVTTLTVLAALVVLSLFIRNAWCRFLCPYGALLGIIALLSPTAIHRSEEPCCRCGLCRAACPSGIAVDCKERVNSPECMGCTACIAACPVEGCLEVRSAGRRIPVWSIAAGTVLTLLAAYAWAVASGHWQADLPLDMLKRVHRMLL